MRITLNLGLFFHDHRSVAKIFVNKKMKYIKDVEEHISSIFKINNFYLKCENQYLPPEEDVQILQYDEIIWAVPVTDQESPRKIEEEIGTVLKKKKKKKKHVEIKEDGKHDMNQNEKQPENENMMEVDDAPLKTKKKKKRLINGDQPPDHIECENVTKRRKLKSPCSDTETVKDSGQDTLSSKSEDFDNKDVNVKFLVSSFESKASPDLHFAPKEPEKRINIVKTIIISKPNDSKFDATELNQKGTNLEDNNQSVDTLSPFDTSSIACSSISEADSNVNKKRRKRSRRTRTRKDNNTTFEQPTYEYVHKPVVVPAPVHLRFNDDPESTTDAIKNNEAKNCTTDVKIETDCVLDNVKVEKPVEKVSQASNEMEKEESNDIIINLENSSDIENCILKQPITDNVEPKLGDVIAFKILRMSENYTPEISSTIVGKVVDYTMEDKQITFNIMYGHQQCSLPNGKFSLDPEEQQPEDGKLRCSWSNLLEPRLLYP